MEKLYNDTKKYYDALRKVNNLIGDAYKVKECILMVGDISDIYVTSYKQMLHDPHFRPSELAAIASGYTKLLEQSGESLKELKSVAKSGVFSMNDHERMQAIDRIYTTLREYRSLVSYYTKEKYLGELRNVPEKRVTSLRCKPYMVIRQTDIGRSGCYGFR